MTEAATSSSRNRATRISRLGSFMFVLHIRNRQGSSIRCNPCRRNPRSRRSFPPVGPHRRGDASRRLVMEVSMEKQDTRFQDWTNLAVGIGLAIYPWVIGYSENVVATRVSV